MSRNPICVFVFSFLLLLSSTSCDEDVGSALLKFMAKLGTSRTQVSNFSRSGWNSASDPCKNHWKGVICNDRNDKVERLFFDDMNLVGTFDPSIICSSVQTLAESLTVISLNGNGLQGENLDHVSNCKFIKMLNLRGNRFSGGLPDSMSRLNNLKVLDISNNQFSGPIPSFDFSSFVKFSVSNNSFSGRIPYGGSRFPASSFIYNPELCGKPLPNECPTAPVVSKLEQAPQAPQEPGEPQEKKKPKSGLSTDQILMFAGYFLIGLVVVLFIVYKFCRKGKKNEEKTVNGPHNEKVAAIDDSSTQLKIMSNEFKSVAIKSNSVVASAQIAGRVSQSVVVSASPEMNGLKFEELLKAPAELLGRGKHGSVYKVMCEELGMHLAVKRVKDSAMSGVEFKQRMKRLKHVKHTNVLPPIAFYTSVQEKLIVYEYQANGSLFKLLHGDQLKQAFDWSSRLNAAATISKALTYMKQELQDDAIAHGNLKSSNILLNKNMEACISEYGLITENQEPPTVSGAPTQKSDNQAAFKSDVYAFGVILLEMLTGKEAVVQTNGMNLAKWVVSVVREEWTVEVFDKSLIRECASEERMVNLLQIAIKCVNESPESRPNINQVAFMINTLKEEDERSMDFSESLNL